eukprot:6208822-Pleurochrysis_carterae.AAC.1
MAGFPNIAASLKRDLRIRRAGVAAACYRRCASSVQAWHAAATPLTRRLRAACVGNSGSLSLLFPFSVIIIFRSHSYEMTSHFKMEF